MKRYLPVSEGKRLNICVFACISTQKTVSLHDVNNKSKEELIFAIENKIALLYMPYASADVARRHLNKCIRRNRELLEALEATGWAFWIHWLTPLQVELIEKYLGEP